MTQTATIEATCTECEAPIAFTSRPMMGQIVHCTDCSAELEVIEREPITLELAPEVEEDWGE